MGKFAAINDAPAAGGGTYFLPGMYLVEVLTCKDIRSTKNPNTQFIVTEFRILESNNPELLAGMRASWVVNYTGDFPQLAWSNLKSFFVAAVGASANDEAALAQINEEFVELATSTKNPLEGLQVRLQCTLTKTKKGMDFTVHRWERVKEEAA